MSTVKNFSYSFMYISETDDKKGNAPLVKSPSTETTSRFSFFWRNKSTAKSEDKASDEEGKLEIKFCILLSVWTYQKTMKY